MFLSEWREFPSAPYFAEKKNVMTARVSVLSKSLACLTCFRACFLPGRAKGLSAHRHCLYTEYLLWLIWEPQISRISRVMHACCMIQLRALVSDTYSVHVKYMSFKFLVKYRCGESYCIASYGPSNNCMVLYTPLPPACHRRAEN